jgi:hypothetical protein
MRDMMSQIRDVGDGIRGGTYTMTAPVITGGSITGVALSGNTLTNPVITGGSINNTTVGATTRSTGAFTTLASNGATTFTAGTASTSTTTGTAVITGGLGVSGRINAANFDGIVGANTAAAGSFTTLSASSTVSGTGFSTYLASPPAIGGTAAAAGNFTTLGATGVATFSAGTVSAPAITTTGDTNTGIFFPAADTIAFTEGGVEAMRITSAGAVLVGQTAANYNVEGISFTKDGYITACADEATANTNSVLYLNRRSSDGEMISFYRDGGQTGFIGTTSTNNMTFATGATERMRITSTGDVGIGTTSPAAPFQVTRSFADSTIEEIARFSRIGGTVGGTNRGAAIVFSDANNLTLTSAVAGIRDNSGSTFNGSLGFYTSNTGGSAATAVSQLTERMRITAAGNVGIGLNNAPIQFAVSDSSAGSYAGISTTRSSPNFFADITVQGQAAGWQGIMRFLVGSNASAATERMRIDSSGNVGIGTSSPDALLSVNGIASFGDGAAATPSIANFGDLNTGFWFPAADTIAASTAGSERMRLDSSGNLMIGTSSAASLPSDGYVFIKSTSTQYIGHASGTASGTGYLQFWLAGVSIGSITQSGTTAVLYNLTSDARLKTNIVDAPLGNIDDVKVRSFDWKSDGSHVEYGFIAQELVEVAPYAVHQPQDPEEMMAVDYSKLVPMMIKEIQDLKQRIATLENK